MKHIVLVVCLLGGLCMNAQVKSRDNFKDNQFDPQRDPVALQSDSTLHLLVSEFILIKALKTRLGPDMQIHKMYKGQLDKGVNCIIFEGWQTGKNAFPIVFLVPLMPDPEQLYYYTSTQAIVCSAPGCNNCSVQNGKCVGCCDSSNESTGTLSQPLSKVDLSVDR